MYVLHLHWSPRIEWRDGGVLVVWVGNGTLKQPRKRKISAKAKPHPFDEIPDAVRELIVAGGLDKTKARASEITLLMPTGAYGPRPSPQLQHGWTLSGDDAPPALAPWTVNGLSLAPKDGFTLLTYLPRPENLPTGLVLGRDIQYWQSVSDLVLEALA